MSAVFADTFFFVALLDEGDQHHAAVHRYLKADDELMVTTRWILAETANYFCGSGARDRTSAFLRNLESTPNVQIVSPSDPLYHRGLNLYAERPDKPWSLTDCISFSVMEACKITKALTADHHFAQAGFVPLFAEA